MTNDQLSEKVFQMRVEQYLDYMEVWYVKIWGNGIQRSGIPDLLLCCNGQFIGVELKKCGGKASKLQSYEIGKIRDSGGYAMVVSPDEFNQFCKFIKQLKNEPIRRQTKYEIFS